MFIAVGQTVLLSALGWAISHQLLNNAYQDATKHHVWQELLDAFDMMDANTTVNGTLSSNATSINSTIAEDHRTFYRKTLPRDILFAIITSPLYYYWQIWLERTFPARPRPAPTSEKTAFSDETSHEEDVIQKWIAQGKVRRASLSWYNTLVKWTLNMVVGSLWQAALVSILSDLYALRLPKPKFSNMKWVSTSSPSGNQS